MPTPEETQHMQQLIDERIAHHLNESERRQKSRMDEGFDQVCDLLRSAFPDGDPVEHRKAHEQMIEFHKQRAEFYRDLKRQLAGKGLLAVLGLILIAVWHYAGDAIRRGGG
jgi:C4-dicarboxylate-specific signal transduction histidine kinase